MSDRVIRLNPGANIQDAVDYCLSASRNTIGARTIELRAGQLYTITAPIVVAASGTFATNLTIRGEVPAFPGLTTNTRIQTTFNDGPALAVQGVRAFHLENLEIIGQNDFVSGLTTIDALVNDAQYIVGGARNNRYSPHCAVAIDPFMNGDPGGSSANRYPALTSYYTAAFSQISGGGNFLKNVVCRNFAAGVVNFPSGLVQGGDNLHLSQCYFQGCRIGFSNCHGQQKTCILEDCHMLYGMHFVDAVTFGAQQGQPPTLIGGDCGWTKAAFNLHHSIGTFSVPGGGFATESMHGLGQLGFGSSSVQQPAVITGREVNFWNALADKNIDVHVVTYRPTIFAGCSFGVNDSTGPPGGSAGTIRIHNTSDEWLVFDHCQFNSDSPNAHLPLDFNWSPKVEMRRCKNRSAELHGVGSLAEVQIGSTTGNLTFVSAGKAQFSTTGAGSDVDVGDHVRLTNQYQPKQYAPSGSGFNTATSVGTVISKAGDTITLGQVPETIEGQLPINGVNFFRRRFTFA